MHGRPGQSQVQPGTVLKRPIKCYIFEKQLFFQGYKIWYWEVTKSVPKKCHKKCAPIKSVIKSVKNVNKMSQNKCTNKCPKKVWKSAQKSVFCCKKYAKKTSVPNPGTVVVISMFSTKMIKLHLLLPKTEAMPGARTVKLKCYPCNSQDSLTPLGQVCWDNVLINVNFVDTSHPAAVVIDLVGVLIVLDNTENI